MAFEKPMLSVVAIPSMIEATTVHSPRRVLSTSPRKLAPAPPSPRGRGPSLLWDVASLSKHTKATSLKSIQCADPRVWTVCQATTPADLFSIQVDATGCQHLHVGLSPTRARESAAHARHDLHGLHVDMRSGAVLWSTDHTATDFDSPRALHVGAWSVGDVLSVAAVESTVDGRAATTRDVFFYKNDAKLDVAVHNVPVGAALYPTVAMKGHLTSVATHTELTLVD
ncbi:Aste57867_10186 [Aphanomyces stellatus]|uniref:Aste57867_10186 protein n=1 Tax=Aphanomyces stellatus TaxID=120398 RepID=A0A485KPT1_9STRA|nr:hypothetical protein As57867_010147 [Aphanomyces stellatus]VFT87062.1 Aste57867_10186 [Aphanomyces stellatus]